MPAKINIPLAVRRPTDPRTRADEILRARGLTPAEACERTGWHQSYLSRLLSGKNALTRTSQVLMARLLECPVEALHEPVGMPIPPRLAVDGQAKTAPGVTNLGGLAGRLQCIATLIGADTGDQIMAYLVYGDDSGLPKRTRVRLHEAMNDLAA